MSVDQSDRRTRSPNRARLDDQGRIIPMTDEERRAWAKSALEGLKAMAEIPDTDPPGSDIEFMKAIDAERPHRPLFKEFY